MYLSKFQLFNYKSFQDSGLLEFTPGINIIVGQNNAGKTALLEALTLNFSDVPHRSIKTLKTPLSTLDNTLSKSKIYIYLEKKELRLMIDRSAFTIINSNGS
ncbi:MAG: AAA family ATPase [Dolichospermum sp.]